MALRGADPESYITEYTSVCEEKMLSVVVRVKDVDPPSLSDHTAPPSLNPRSPSPLPTPPCFFFLFSSTLKPRIG